LLRGGCCSEVFVKTGLTALTKPILIVTLTTATCTAILPMQRVIKKKKKLKASDRCCTINDGFEKK
jgi:hypothetical protein